MYGKIKGKENGQLEGDFFQQRSLIYGTRLAWKRDEDTTLSLDATHPTHSTSCPLHYLPEHTVISWTECSDQKLEYPVLLMVLVITLLIKGHPGLSKAKQ